MLDVATVTFGTPLGQNLLTNVDAEAGIFLNKGYTLVGIRGTCWASNQVNVAGAGLGTECSMIIAPIDAALTGPPPAFDGRDLTHRKFWLHTWYGATTGTSTNTVETRGVPIISKSKWRIPDNETDLFAIVSCTGGAGEKWNVGWDITCWFAMP